MIDGVKVAPRPAACAVNSRHQSLLTARRDGGGGQARAELPAI
jgi:hypothetical protein